MQSRYASAALLWGLCRGELGIKPAVARHYANQKVLAQRGA
jgi:hypothetical protein